MRNRSCGYEHGRVASAPARNAVLQRASCRRRSSPDHAGISDPRRGELRSRCLDSSMVGAALLIFLAQEIEALERHPVGNDEDFGVTTCSRMAGKAPVRNRKYVVLRPVERMLAYGRVACSGHDQADHIASRTFRPSSLTLR